MKKVPALMAYVSSCPDDNIALEATVLVSTIVAIEPIDTDSCRILISVQGRELWAAEPAEILIKRWIDLLVMDSEPKEGWNSR